MGERNHRVSVRTGATHHLEDALEVADPTEKDFHVKQALQLLGIQTNDS